jgi:hypothetical protein
MSYRYESNNGIPMAPSPAPGSRDLEAYPNEGFSFDYARVESYADTSFMVWDQPGQTVELAPVTREGTAHGWCTVEQGLGLTMPDIFNVNDGGKGAVVEIARDGKPLVIIQDGYLYAEGKAKMNVVDLEEYFTAEHPIIGGDWLIGRRDGGRAILLRGITSIRVELSQENMVGVANDPHTWLKGWPLRHTTVSESGLKLRSDRLRKIYPHHRDATVSQRASGIGATVLHP